jgi:hypothetical protein
LPPKKSLFNPVGYRIILINFQHALTQLEKESKGSRDVSGGLG